MQPAYDSAKLWNRCLVCLGGKWNITLYWSIKASNLKFSPFPNYHAVVVQMLSCVWRFVIPWTAACQDSLSFTVSQCLPKLMSTESVMPSNYLCCLFFSCLQSFLASGSFPMSHLFALGGQSTRVSASASVLAMNIQGWFPLGLTGLISRQFKGLSRIFSSTTVQKYQFFSTQPSLWSTSLTTYDYWKNYSFDYMDLCRQITITNFKQ